MRIARRTSCRVLRYVDICGFQGINQSQSSSYSVGIYIIVDCILNIFDSQLSLPNRFEFHALFRDRTLWRNPSK